MKDVRIDRSATPTNKVLIIFNAVGADTYFNFENFSGEFHKIYVRNPGMDWYLKGVWEVGNFKETLKFLLEEARKLCEGKPQIFTLGSSRGAYAALLYGHRLRAKRALAFAPEYDLTVKKSRAYGRKRISGQTDLSFLKDSKLKAIICGGRYDPLDYYCILKIRELKNENITAALFDNHHGVARSMKYQKTLGKFLKRWIDRKNPYRIIEEEIENANAEKGNPEAIYNFLNNDNEALLESEGNEYFKFLATGDKQYLLKLIADEPNNIIFKYDYCKLMQNTGRFEEASEIAEEVLKLTKSSNHPHRDLHIKSIIDLADIYFEMGNKEKAAEYVTMASSMDEKSKAVRELLQRHGDL